MPVRASEMKLTIMSACRPRLRRVNRWNCGAFALTLPSMPLVLLSFGRSGVSRLGLEGALLGLLRLAQLAPHLQRARQPQERVRAADDERADEERGHAPERPEEPGVLLGVVVRGVAEVSGEAARRARVALLARLGDVLAREVRARVGDPLDVVRAVAV